MKKIFTSFLSLFLFSASSFAQVDLTTGLVGNYPFSGNANDASPSANNGTVNGATPTTDRFGNANSAYSFDGVSSYISLSPTNLLLANYTYAAWVNIKTNPATNDAAAIISIGKVAGDQSMSVANQYNTVANTGFSAAGYNSATSVASTISGTLPTPSIWYHVVSTRSNSAIKLYINGLLVKSAPVSVSAYYGTASGQLANIGTRSNSNIQYFSGKIDDVKIYNRALSDCEVSALANQSVAKNLLASYPFNGNADDASGNGNDGSVTGATLTTDRFGNANSAYSFNGVTDKIEISPTNLLAQFYTYSAWVKIKTLPGNDDNAVILSIGGDTGGDQVISVGNNYSTSGSTGWLGNGYDIGGTTVSGNTSGTLPTTGIWYHVVSTRSVDSMKLYVNGVLLKKSKTNNITGYGNSPFAATIGTRSHGDFQYFNGSIDDIKIFNRELVACEIKDLFDEQDVSTATINPELNEAVKLYPNPNDGKFSIELPSSYGFADITIHNSVGSIVHKEVVNTSKSIQLNNLPSGIYIIKLRTEDGKEMARKFIVK